MSNTPDAQKNNALKKSEPFFNNELSNCRTLDNPKKRPILTSTELIEHMKAKGIKFTIINETDAKHFLEDHNYFFKLSSYRKNYMKYQKGEKKDTYLDLEFAYLKDLSIIDMHLRHLLLELSLDIEHAIKLTIIRDIETNPHEDGYKIVSKFIEENNYQFNYSRSNYCQDLVQKYKDIECPIWAFCEVLSFGELTRLYDLYARSYEGRLPLKPLFIYAVRNIRNAVAHNNCLINDLTSKNKYPNNEISNIVSNIPGISENLRRSKLKHYFLHDFVALIYAYSILVKSEGLKKHQYQRIKRLFYIRMQENKHYYTSNNTIKSSFKFCHLIIKNFLRYS